MDPTREGMMKRNGRNPVPREWPHAEPVPPSVLPKSFPFRGSVFAMLAVYGLMALLVVATGQATGQLHVPSWALPYLVALLPLLTIAVKELITWIEYGTVTFPAAVPVTASTTPTAPSGSMLAASRSVSSAAKSSSSGKS